jgi:hypothetical protein
MRFFSALFLSLAMLASSSLASVNVVPTTTLAKESGPNTSASPNFAGAKNGVPSGTHNVSRVNIHSSLPDQSTKVYAHFMPWFGKSNHENVGYDSTSPIQTDKQVEDMVERGLNGTLIDWYGQGPNTENTTTLAMMNSIEKHPGFEFGIVYDGFALKNVTNRTARLISDLNYMAKTYYTSPSYMKRGGRPVVLFFSMEIYAADINWNTVRSQAVGQPLFIFRNSGSFSKPESNGGYSWIGLSSDPNNPGLGYLENFYKTGFLHPTETMFGSLYPGFNDSVAAWGSNRLMNRNCGKTWLSTIAEVDSLFANGRHVDNLQLVTWNDYEEGTELETGIDNCIGVASSMSGGSLNWSTTGAGDPLTLDHFTVFVSKDGVNLMPLLDVDKSTRTLDLTKFALAPGTYEFYVKAVGAPFMFNAMSAMTVLTVTAPTPPVIVRSVQVSATLSSPVTITATSSFTGSLALWVDGAKKTSQSGLTLSFTMTLASGSHRIVVTATDAKGTVNSTPLYITVK